MILALDIGNTRIKAAVFEQYKILQVFVFADTDVEKNVTAIFEQYAEISHIVVSDVAQHKAFPKFDLPVTFISRHHKFPFVNNYQTPMTLGIDRMVLAAGAVLQFPQQNRLVIDAGTCITYDYIDSNDVYQGGAISPGIRLRYEAMHNFTANLPLLSKEQPDHFIGRSTAASMHSGVIQGAANEIAGFIDLYRAESPNFTIILTGGDGEFLANRLKNTIFANSNFLLESLNRTFLYSTND